MSFPFVHEAPETGPDLTLKSNEHNHIVRIMDECKGNISEAARRLGIHRRSLQRKLVRMGYKGAPEAAPLPKVEAAVVVVPAPAVELCGWPDENDIECPNACVPPAHACPKHLAFVATWRMGSVDIGEPDEEG